VIGNPQERSMRLEESHAQIGYRGGAISRAKQVASKALLVLGGVLVLASAFVVSLAFLAIGLAVVLIGGGYLWWQTRELRRQIRARMQQGHEQPQYAGDVIEGEASEVVPQERTRR
jgi:protein-S-isoprenylcysteine O-methyltransferase Ste14